MHALDRLRPVWHHDDTYRPVDTIAVSKRHSERRQRLWRSGLCFEFARVPQDLINLFVTVDDPERMRRMAMMDAGNRWDFLFMTIYGMFGVFFDVAAARNGSKLWIYRGIGGHRQPGRCD